MTLVPHKAWRIEKEYGSLDYKGMTVLDIGADYGCTPEFFLSRGARIVVAVERDEEFFGRLADWVRENELADKVPLYQGLYEGNVELLFTRHSPDIIKVDCEGCECELLRLNDNILSKPQAWIMETHSMALYDSFVRLFRRLRYNVTIIEEFPKNPPERHRKVFKAEKRPAPRVRRVRR